MEQILATVLGGAVIVMTVGGGLWELVKWMVGGGR